MYANHACRIRIAQKINPAVPREVSRIVAHCLKENVGERYQNADELLQEVKNYLSGEKSPGKTAAALLGLKKSFAFSAKNASESAINSSVQPNRTGENSFQNTADVETYQTDSSGAAIYPNQTAGKKLPVAMIAVASSVGVVLLFSIVGLGVWMMKSSSAADAENNSAAGVVSNLMDAKNTNLQTAKIGAARYVKVDLDEGSAQVFRDNQTVDSTPFDLEAADGEKVNLTLKRDGYEDKSVQLEVSSRKQVYTFSLKPK